MTDFVLYALPTTNEVNTFLIILAVVIVLIIAVAIIEYIHGSSED